MGARRGMPETANYSITREHLQPNILYSRFSLLGF